MEPDKTDWQIIDILRQGYVSNNEIAKRLSISEGTVRNRIKKLKDAGIMTVRAQINPDVLENQQLAVVAIKVNSPQLLEHKAKEISKLEKVLSVTIASGRYDLLVDVLVDSNKGLVNFLTDKLSTIDGISATETFLMLKTYRKYI
jgi:Lrp/AsnC family transcriptional regulator for asnA, asnC and gidA